MHNIFTILHKLILSDKYLHLYKNNYEYTKFDWIRKLSIQTKSEKYSFKIILLGDAGVGKTSIRRKYMGHTFEKNYMATIGADLSIKRLGNSIFQIWDLGGQLGYQFVRSEYYVGAAGLILVFDITREETKENIDNWLIEIKKNLVEPVPIILVGNKSDLNKTYTADVSALIRKLERYSQYKVNYIETSALTGSNIDEMFSILIKQLDEYIARMKNS